MAPDHVHQVGGSDHRGPDAVEAMAVRMRETFPDLTFVVEEGLLHQLTALSDEADARA